MHAISTFRSPHVEAALRHPFFRLSDSMGYTSWAPALDLSETDEAFRVVMEIPGVDPNAIEVSFEAGNLVIRGEKQRDLTSDKNGYQRVERSYGSFERDVRVGAPVDAEKIAADCHDGVLTITLPKAASARARKISING